jgi:hypothetical protein
MSQVVIGDILPYTQATAILNQTVFGTNWTANTESDVVVYVTPPGDDPDDVTQILPYPAGYSVAFIGALEQVQVTLVTPSVAGAIVTIIRDTPADRMNLYSNTNFTPSMLNNDFGILTLVDQQAQLVDQKVGPRYNYSAVIVDVVDTILPILGANETWVKNAGNTAIIPYTLPSSGIAPADATYVTITDETAVLPNSINFVGVASGIVVFNPTGSGDFFSRAITGTALQIGITNGDGIAGNPTVSILANAVIPGTAGMGIPAGTTAERVVPTPPSIGLRFNTTLGSLEFYFGGSWVQIEDSTDLATLLAMLASHAVNEGASLIGLQTPSTSTVQDLSEAEFYVLNASDALPNAILFDPADYLPLAGGTMTGAIDMGTFGITNAANPVNPQDLTTKLYVDNLVFNIHAPCYAATTANLATYTYTNGTAGVGARLTNSVNGAFSTDGTSPPINSRILVPFQTATEENGVYTVLQVGDGSTGTILERATDYDEASEIQPGDRFLILNGTLYGATDWVETAVVTTIGTDPITFQMVGDVGTVSSITAGAGLTATPNPITTSGTIALDASITIGASAPAGSLTIAGTTGYVQAPNNVSFYAQLGSAVTDVTGDGTVYTIIFATQNYDIGGGYNPATGVFTAPVAGKYIFRWGAAIGQLGASHTSGDGLYLNTSSEGNQYTTIGNYFAMSSSGTLYLYSAAICTMTAGATAEVRVMIAGGTKTVDIGDTGATQFRGMLIP